MDWKFYKKVLNIIVEVGHIVFSLIFFIGFFRHMFLEKLGVEEFNSLILIALIAILLKDKE